MSSLIEQAALRLEQLRQAGVVIPEPTALADTLPQRAVARAATATPPAQTPAQPAPARGAAPGAPAAPPAPRITLDIERLAGIGILAPNGARSRLGDQFRIIKRPLIENAAAAVRGGGDGQHLNMIMVTSAVAGEGKTFTSINLAMSIAAEVDHTVMLVDADVARPSLMSTLGLPPRPGLLDVLDGSADMSSVMLRTNIDKLTLLPSGTPQARATELLASDSMRQLVDQIATRYPDRIVIFDSPPLLLTTEARELASHMGQIVVVVHADRTLQADVQHALASIESCPIRFLVLNQMKAERKSRATGYGYQYEYGYGYEKPAA